MKLTCAPRRRSPRGTRLPIVAIRCEPDLRDSLWREAEAQSTTASSIVREALASHLAGRGKAAPEAAHAAYVIAAEKHFGEFARSA